MNGDNRLKGGSIMSGDDYNRLLKYTQDLMDFCRIPQNIEPIAYIKLTKQQIVYTYNLLHNHLFPDGARRKQYFLFLDKVFTKLHQPNLKIDKDNNYQKSNSYKKFTTEPDRYKKLN